MPLGKTSPGPSTGPWRASYGKETEETATGAPRACDGEAVSPRLTSHGKQRALECLAPWQAERRQSRASSHNHR